MGRRQGSSRETDVGLSQGCRRERRWGLGKGHCLEGGGKWSDSACIKSF